MNRSKILPKLILLTTLGILIFSFIPAVAASEGKGKVTERPIDDWLVPNHAWFWWGEDNWGFADFVSPDSGFVCKAGFPWPKAGYFPPWINDFLDEICLVEGETTFDGRITERVLKNGEALITLHLEVKNAPLTVFDIDELFGWVLNLTERPSAILGAGIDGYIDYKIVYKFTIPKPGDPLPMVFGSFATYISLNIIGTGYGTLTEHSADFGFTPGALGMLKLHQVALVKPALKEDHPKYYPPELWPVETVEIYEIG